jgi:uracil-DNA glycosylase
MIVGEASGESEAREQLPFRPYAPAGSLLERTIKRMSMDRAQFAITNALRCFDGDVVVPSTGIRKVYRRSYAGDIVWVKTNLGELSGTPNHPVLTHRGMVPLQELTQGDNLVYDPLGETVRPLQPNVHHRPTKFSELFRSLSETRGGEWAAGRPIDFHGDGKHSEVEVINIDRQLGYWVEPISSEVSEELSLQPSNGGAVFPLQGFSPSREHTASLPRTEFDAAHRSMGRFCYSLSSFDSKAFKPEPLSLRTVTNAYASLSEGFTKCIGANPSSTGKWLGSLPTNVTFAEVIKVNRGGFSGHVYNLEMDSGIYTADGFIVSNCHPPQDYMAGAPWEYAALAHCRPNLAAAIAQHRPRCFLALGGTALRQLTGLAGEKLGVSHLRGFVLPTQGSDLELDEQPVPVVPSFHPAFVRRGAAHLQGVLARDMQRAKHVAAGKNGYLWVEQDVEERCEDCVTDPQHDCFICGGTGVAGTRKTLNLSEALTHGNIQYQAHPSLDEAWGFYQRVRDNAGLVVCYDLETHESASLDEDARDGFADTAIRLSQFSTQTGQGIAFPWEGKYRDIARHILQLPNVKTGHNVWLFDNKVLAAVSAREGIDYMPVGTVHDTLQMFHWWQPDLPAHLQFAASFVNFPFPWKHLAGTEPELYGCADVDATLRLYHMLEATMKRDGIWE